jgi:hypothetical protein
MKTLKFPLVFSFVLLTFFNFSQSNTLVVFAQDPTPFYIVLDGVKKNEVAETRVVIPGIRQTNSNVQVYFKDESIPSITKNIWWDEEHKNDEVSFRIVPTKKGYKLRFFSTVPNKVTPQNPVTTVPQPTQSVQATTTTVVTETTTVRNNNNNGTTINANNVSSNSNPNVNGNLNAGVNMNVDMNAGGNTNASPDMSGGSISMNINMNDGSNMNAGNENINMNMNINMNDGNMNAVNPPNNGNMSINMNVNEGYTNTAVPVDGQINVNMNDTDFNNAMNQANSNMTVDMNVNESVTTNTTNNATQFNNSANTTNIDVNETVTTTVTTTTINETPVAAPVSLGGCVNPVQDMTSIMAAIDEESFDDGKIIVAKQATSKKCLTVDQIKQIMDEFSFSKNKLNFAKYAYKRCYNPDDYYQVNGAFDFSSDKEEMNEFINDQN